MSSDWRLGLVSSSIDAIASGWSPFPERAPVELALDWNISRRRRYVTQSGSHASDAEHPRRNDHSGGGPSPPAYDSRAPIAGRDSVVQGNLPARPRHGSAQLGRSTPQRLIRSWGHHRARGADCQAGKLITEAGSRIMFAAFVAAGLPADQAWSTAACNLTQAQIVTLRRWVQSTQWQAARTGRPSAGSRWTSALFASVNGKNFADPYLPPEAPAGPWGSPEMF